MLYLVHDKKSSENIHGKIYVKISNYKNGQRRFISLTINAIVLEYFFVSVMCFYGYFGFFFFFLIIFCLVFRLFLSIRGLF